MRIAANQKNKSIIRKEVTCYNRGKAEHIKINYWFPKENIKGKEMKTIRRKMLKTKHQLLVTMMQTLFMMIIS